MSSCRRAGESELCVGVGAVMEVQVVAAAVEKEDGHREEDKERGAEESYDQSKVGLVGGLLFDVVEFHAGLDADLRGMAYLNGESCAL